MLKTKAFTLIELLVVMSIISLLVAVLLPSLATARRAAQSIKCASNVKQLGLAFQMYIDDNHDYFPLNWNGNAQWPYGSWQLKHIAYYINFTYNHSTKILPEIYHCPSDNNFNQKSPGEIHQDEPSYGYNYYWLGRGATDIKDAVFFKRQDVKNPATTILAADSGHFSEDGKSAMDISFGNTSYELPPRHQSDTANMLWVDLHLVRMNIDIVNNEFDYWKR